MKRRIAWSDTVPFPDNIVYDKRLQAMRREWGGYVHGIVGSPAVCDNTNGAFPDLPETALVVVDGNHRRELAREDGKLGDEILADLHRGLGRAEVHKLRRGLNDRRTVKPAETFLELCEEGNHWRRALKGAVEGLGWEISPRRGTGVLPCTNELEWIWNRDRGAVTRTIQTYERCWGRTQNNAQAKVIKGLGAFWIKYPDADIDHVVRALKGTTPQELYRAGRNQNEEVTFIRTVVDGIRYVIMMHYNRGRRGKGVLAL